MKVGCLWNLLLKDHTCISIHQNTLKTLYSAVIIALCIRRCVSLDVTSTWVWGAQMYGVQLLLPHFA